MAPQLGYKGAGGNLNTMPLEGNQRRCNPNNVIRIEYEVRLLGHDRSGERYPGFLIK